MSSREFFEWQVFDSLSPIGDERGDLGSGIIASTVVNWAGKQMKQGAKHAIPSDFMPYVTKQESDEQALSNQIREAFLKRG